MVLENTEENLIALQWLVGYFLVLIIVEVLSDLVWPHSQCGEEGICSFYWGLPDSAEDLTLSAM